MQKAILIKGLIVFPCLLFLFQHFVQAQCYGPSSTGNYTNGKKPSTSSNYFVNHVFSTFNTFVGIPVSGSLNGNNFSVTATGGLSINTVVNISPAESLVSGSGFPSSAPQSQNVSTSILSAKITHTFTSDLAVSTHVFLQDVDRLEGWSIVFKNSSGAVIDPSGFTPFNASTTNLPATFTATATSLSFKSTSTTNRSEPLVGVIITGSGVRTIEFTVTTIASVASNTEFFYSVPLTPSFTGSASNNSPVCAGSTLTLTGGTSALATTVPTPVNYIWSGPNSYSNTTTSTTSNISSVTTAATGTYSLQVQDAFGCFTSSAVTTVATINATPSVTASSNTPVNYGNTINLSASISGGTTPYTIAWTGPNSFSSSSQNPSVASVSSVNAGVYTVQVTGNNGCIASTTAYVAVKSGWIYIHDKNINEESSVDFTFTLKDNSDNLLKTFYTNDSAGNTRNVYDIGAGHDNGAGTLWAVAGTAAGTSNTGTVYYRASGSTNWIPTNVTNATAVDGAALNQFVYVTSSGDGYFYNGGTSTLIFNHLTQHNSQTALASDIAYGGGKVALRNANGRVYLYTGDFTNDSWTDISNNANIAARIDLSSDGTTLVYILSATVKIYDIATGITTTLPAFTTLSGGGASGTLDIAIDDNGAIYATSKSGNTSCCGNTDIVYSYASGATSWTAEPEARGVMRLTGGPGGQAWGSIYIGSTFPQTIYTRVTDNTGIHLWLDDERVKNASSLYTNSIMMEVDPGVYKVNAVMPDATWDVGRFNIYDPTGNTTANSNSGTATIRPADGEVVHVEFIIEKLIIKVIDNANCTTNILQSFDAGTDLTQFGTGTFGTAVRGTAYHYFNLTSPQDGYYAVVKTTDGNWFTSPGVTDHTGNGGYFFLVNASYAKDEFFRQRITGLTGNLTYRIQFYTSNVLAINPIKPKIRFGMQTLSGVIFGDSTTPEITTSAWQLYSVSFTVPDGVTTADLFLRNENIGGSGNDLAIDDISINPIPTPLDTNVIHPAILSNLCVGSTYLITNSIGGGSWSTSDPSVVTIDAATGSITINSIGSASITYTYINNIYCLSTAVSNVSISVPPTVSLSSSTYDVCRNNSTVLSSNAASGTAPYSYLWTGSGGTLSSTTVANPTFIAPSTGGTYNYSVTVTDNVGCTSPTTNVPVTVHAPLSGISLFCNESESNPYAQITEVGGETGSSWLWTATSPNAFFYPNSAFYDGSSTSTLRSPYINFISQYKVVLTDPYGCKDSTTMFYDNTTCRILPILLLSFSAANNYDGVLLKWTTSFETNTKHFLVERSTDENTWTTIGKLDAAGNSTTEKTYSFTDAMPAVGMNYYKLKQIDANGNYSYSGVRPVLVNDVWKVKLYPNPATGGRLQIQSNSKIKSLRITDVNGIAVLNKPALVSSDLNISSLARGYYFVEVVNDKNEVYYTNFIKY